MRQSCDWFAHRATAVWKAQPGRSMLVMVPQGCDESGAARLVRLWISANFLPPAAFANHRPTCVDLVADGLESSAHFAQVVASKIARHLEIEIEGDVDDYPTDVLQNAVEAALGAGVYPILTIERFHAFASIRDGGMASILSRLRTMESDGQLTTLAFSPMGYDAIRQEMDAEQPFLNSVYGDMHDEAVMTPLTRADFLAEAERRGVDAPTGHRLFGLGGGPDAVFHSLLDMATSDTQQLVEKCAERIGPKIDRFLARAFPKLSDTDPLIDNLAVGRLNAAQQASLLNHPLANFLYKRNSASEIICSSPIIARRILAKGLPLWSQYGACIEAVEANEYARAAEMAGLLTDPHPRLALFRELVLLKGALSAVPDRGLLGLDWPAANEAMKRLRRMDAELLWNFAAWLDATEQSIRIVIPSNTNHRLQADNLTRHAGDKTVRLLLLFMIDGLLSAVPGLSKPSARVHALVNVPEAILQALAAGFCAIDFSAPPSEVPEADYNSFFGSTEPFVFPAGGQKLSLGNLLVIVPALLAARRVAGAKALIDQDVMKPLQQKLVDAVRNPASHTIASFAQKDSIMLETLCRGWIDEWCKMEGIATADALPMRSLAPRGTELRALVIE